MHRAGLALALVLLSIPRIAVSQVAASGVGGPALGSFTAVRVSVTPLQSWQPDTAGWSRQVVWTTTRVAIDSTLQAILEERGLGRKWAYASDMVRTARRNPTYASDPYALGVAALRAMELKLGAPLPQGLADNLRPFTALGDTRVALIPFELRARGEEVVVRLVVVDTRGRTLLWAGELTVPGGANMVSEVATGIANLIIEP